ncbi:MAG: hypothetical protein AUK44_06105 [Porphyromonadaceae bacterium CG2_30_38_12]|nr:MAG: hypothetical protein AUK44_06105 [Porphyromonadaceae bacterium CG2_30_38_12]
MKSKHYISISCVILTFTATAQNVDRNITVEREYKPVIQDAGKITSVPAVTDADTEKAPAKYNDFYFPMTIGPNVYPLQAADLQLEKRRTPAQGFARIGLGNYMNTLVDFATPIINSGDMRLDTKIDHLGTFGTKKLATTNAALIFNNFYKNAELFAGVKVGHEYFNYYGNNFDASGNVANLNSFTTDKTTLYTEQNLTTISRNATDYSLEKIRTAPLDNVFLRLNANIGFRSTPDKVGLRYEAQVKYNRFDSKNGLNEDIIHTIGKLNTENGKNRMGIDFDLQNILYSSNLPATEINVLDTYAVFAMNPYYSFERSAWNVRLGVKSSFSFVQGRAFSPSPDLRAEWRAIPRWLAFYGGADGGYKVNTLDVSAYENRYLFADLRIKDTYTPLKSFVGIKFKPAYNVLVDAYLSYQYIDNQYFFTNKDYKTSTPILPNESDIYTNRFNVEYSAAQLTNLGLRANYNIRNTVNVQWKAAYNGWETRSAQHAWLQPKFETDLSAELRINRNLQLSSNIFYVGERFAKLGNQAVSMKPYTDVNVGASYSYSNWFTVFAKVNNLLNANYANFYGYDVQRINGLVGASFSF